MRYSTLHNGRSDLWQRILFVLLGAACVVLCYFAGAYVIGPLLVFLRQKPAMETSATSPVPPPTDVPATPPASKQSSPISPKMAGVQIRERSLDSLSDTVRVIPPPGSATPDESTPTEEPQPPTTLEEHPSPPPSNLWNPTPSRPADVGSAESGVQLPETLDYGATPSGSTSSAPAPSETLYRVRVSATFANREEAEATLRSVTERQLPAVIVTDTVGGRRVFRVQLGVYRNRGNAEKLAEQARRAGIPAEVAVPSP